MMANVELTCTVCSQTNQVQRVHTNMLAKGEMRTFCSACGVVTEQKVSGASAPPVAQQTPIRSNSPTRSITAGDGHRQIDDKTLWSYLEAQLKNNGLQMDDVSRRDDETRGRLFGTLGFGQAEEQRLVDMASKKFNPHQSSRAGASNYAPSAPPAAPTEPQSPQQPAKSRPSVLPTPAAPSGGYQPTTLPSSMAGRGGNNSTPLSNPRATPPGAPPAGSALNPRPGATSPPGAGVPGSNPAAANRLQTVGESAVKGLTMGQDGSIVARCSVHPHLPAEYWCCACSVLVSSRCHVQGIHKDHPFVPLRLAAESHVRDLCAWNDRCRAQLNVIDTISNNLKHVEEDMQHNLQRELHAVDEAAQQVAMELERWKEQLKADIQTQVNAQMGGLQFARTRTTELREHYGTYLGLTEPLMNSIPPVQAEDRDAEHWALRVLDAVTKMKHVTAEAIPIPKLTVPQVQCNAAPSMFMELIKCASIPLQMKLPDLVDPGYFNYPHPSSSAKQAFTLTTQGDPASKGLVVTNGRTLSRTQDVLPSHCLVMGSQVMYSGNHGWEVHIDRIGQGGGRILAGVVVNGSDGEGVVWDGNRIVGPNEGEVRNLDDKIVWQTGSILRFYLELEGQTGYLSCFFNNDGVARIPLPASGSGWTPAFSCFGPQDQITIAPSTTAAGGPGVAVAGTPRLERRPVASAAGDTVQALESQQSMLNALHQQISHINFKLEQQALKQTAPFGTEPSQGGTMSQQGGAGHMSQNEALYPQIGGGGGASPQPNMMMAQQQGGNQFSPNPARPGQPGFDPNNTVMPAMGAVQPAAGGNNVNAGFPGNFNNNNQGNVMVTGQPQAAMNKSAYQQPGQPGAAAAAPQMAAAAPGATASGMFSGTDTYSPELRQIMKYVDTVNH